MRGCLQAGQTCEQEQAAREGRRRKVWGGDREGGGGGGAGRARGGGGGGSSSNQQQTTDRSREGWTELGASGTRTLAAPTSKVARVTQACNQTIKISTNQPTNQPTSYSINQSMQFARRACCACRTPAACGPLHQAAAPQLPPPAAPRPAQHSGGSTEGVGLGGRQARQTGRGLQSLPL